MRRSNKYIPTNRGYKIELYAPNTLTVIDYVEISKEDYDKCSKVFWTKSQYGYARGYYKGKMILLHKYITNTDSSVILDHIDRNKLNCNRDNLRVVTKSINSFNRDPQANSTTGCSGVSFDNRKQKYRAYIKHNGRQRFLGYYDTLAQAVSVRNNAIQALFSLLGIEDIPCTN